MAEITESVKTNMVFEDHNEIKIEYIKSSVDNYIRQVNLSQTKDLSETPQLKLANALTEVLFNSEKAKLFKTDIVDSVVDHL